MTDDELIDAFRRAVLPQDRWHHPEHVRVAWLTLADSDSLEQAMDRLRDGIRRLNRSHGVEREDGSPVEPGSGYHETLTRAFLTLIHARRRDGAPAPDSSAFWASNPDLAKPLLLRHYSRERLLSAEARARFVEPDLEPLPG